MAKKAKTSAKTSRAKKKPSASRRAKKSGRVPYPGMMGDGTEEQNLNQRGSPKARIKKKEVTAAFRKKRR
ncbi:MAG: hypothetical protein ACR2K5_16805 [Pseudolabrys sp.]